MTVHLGWNHERRSGLVVAPGDTLLCCDVRSFPMNRRDLRGVVFWGCLLNGATFLDSDLTSARFVGCFSSDEYPPTAFRGSQVSGLHVFRCHLNYMADAKLSGEVRWPDHLAAVASQALAPRNDVRYEAVKRLAECGNGLVVPFLGAMLNDPEWEVRAVASRAIAKLLPEFPEGGAADFEQWLLLQLGDVNVLARQSAGAMLTGLSPSESSVRAVLQRIASPQGEDRLVGLRAGVELCEHDPRFVCLIDLDAVKDCLSDQKDDIRIAATTLMEVAVRGELDEDS